MAEAAVQLAREAATTSQPLKQVSQRNEAASKSKAPSTPASSTQSQHSGPSKRGGISVSVLDAQLEALVLQQQQQHLQHQDDSSASTLQSALDSNEPSQNSLLELDTEDILMFHPRKGPNSLLGTGSSIASSDHEVSSSDFESDSGIETSHPEIPSPDVGVVLSKPTKKGVGTYVDVMPHDDLAVVSTSSRAVVDQSNAGEKSCDVRIDSFIQCLDEKVNKEALTKEALELLGLIPEGYIPLPHQVGGHRHVDGKLGFLRRVGQRDILFKPVPAAKGPREVQFYKNLFGSRFSDASKEVIALKELVPKYYGTHEIVDRAGQIHQFIKLEDIVSRFRKPCIIDVKVGRRVWDDFAQQDKIDREKKKYPQQEIIGFRIIGMRVYRSSTEDYEYYNKEYGRSVSVNGALDALKKFFMDGDVKRSDVIGPLVERLYYFLHWMEQQKLYKLFATSLIIVYEGDTNRPIRKPKDLLDIRLVDFAHAYERNPKEFCEPDYNTIFGLRNLIKYLEQLNVSTSSA